MAAASVKKERRLPTVALDLLRLALQEDKFPRFWKEVVEQGLLKKHFWPARCVWHSLRSTPLLQLLHGAGLAVHPGSRGL